MKEVLYEIISYGDFRQQLKLEEPKLDESLGSASERVVVNISQLSNPFASPSINHNNQVTYRVTLKVTACFDD